MKPTGERIEVSLGANLVLRAIWLLASVAALVVGRGAQTSRGTVSGTITDPSGAVVAGASVVLTNTATGVHRSATTNEAGIYRFDAVDLGVYELKVTHSGFNAFLVSGLGVEANRITVIDRSLEVGSEATAVQVSAEAESLVVRDGPLRGGNFLPRQVNQTATDRPESDFVGRHPTRRDPALRHHPAFTRRRGGRTVLRKRPASAR